jgi:hypothetical protein
VRTLAEPRQRACRLQLGTGKHSNINRNSDANSIIDNMENVNTKYLDGGSPLRGNADEDVRAPQPDALRAWDLGALARESAAGATGPTPVTSFIAGSAAP